LGHLILLKEKQWNIVELIGVTYLYISIYFKLIQKYITRYKKKHNKFYPDIKKRRRKIITGLVKNLIHLIYLYTLSIKNRYLNAVNIFIQMHNLFFHVNKILQTNT